MMTILLFVPDLGVLAELALEHADGPRPAHIVGHQHIGLHPDIVARRNLCLARRARHQFFRQRHIAHHKSIAPTRQHGTLRSDGIRFFTQRAGKQSFSKFHLAFCRGRSMRIVFFEMDGRVSII